MKNDYIRNEYMVETPVTKMFLGILAPSSAKVNYCFGLILKITIFFNYLKTKIVNSIGINSICSQIINWKYKQ